MTLMAFGITLLHHALQSRRARQVRYSAAVALEVGNVASYVAVISAAVGIYLVLSPLARELASDHAKNEQGLGVDNAQRVGRVVREFP
jgi:hypothetical protein